MESNGKTAAAIVALLLVKKIRKRKKLPQDTRARVSISRQNKSIYKKNS